MLEASTRTHPLDCRIKVLRDKIFRVYVRMMLTFNSQYQLTLILKQDDIDQAQASDQFLATNKEICLKTKKTYIRAKCTFKDF